MLWWIVLIAMGCSGARPTNLGVTEGNLAPCPASPNCVSTQSEDKARSLEPLPYDSSQLEAKEKLITILKSMKRTKIVSSKDDYIHAECTSAIFRYIDDVEFYIDDVKKVIHFRSSSRLGYYDVGVNQRRMERIREQFLKP
jgi:uncharacterized protein (DUF1499 family)